MGINFYAVIDVYFGIQHDVDKLNVLESTVQLYDSANSSGTRKALNFEQHNNFLCSKTLLEGYNLNKLELVRQYNVFVIEDRPKFVRRHHLNSQFEVEVLDVFSDDKATQGRMATVVERFVQFTWLSERLRGGLGQHFGHALSLAHRQIRKDNLDSNDNEMTLVYRVREHSSLDGKRLSASTCLALIDEFTTVHVASINPQSSFPGVSVHLQLKRAASLPPVGSEVVLASKITRLGRTMAFIRAELRDSQDGNLICFGSHVKYLPTGSWILDFFLTGWRISLQPLYGHYFLRDPTFDPDGPSLRQGITSSLVYTGIGRATFEVKPIHTNPLGSMHVSDTLFFRKGTMKL